MKIFPGTHTTNHVDVCPACGRPIEMATGIGEGVVPEPGAFSVCFECGEISRFTDDLTLRLMKRGELRELPPDRRRWVLSVRADIQARGPLTPSLLKA